MQLDTSLDIRFTRPNKGSLKHFYGLSMTDAVHTMFAQGNGLP